MMPLCHSRLFTVTNTEQDADLISLRLDSLCRLTEAVMYTAVSVVSFPHLCGDKYGHAHRS